LKLRFWGTRGSIPSPGPDTIKYGGNTTCLELRLEDNTLIVFDAGTGIRNLGSKIIEQNNDKHINLFLSHSHWDHIQGFPFFLPAYREEIKIKIYGCPPVYDKLKDILTDQMESRYFPVNFDELKAEIEFEEINHGQHPIGNAQFSFIENNHPGTAYGYKVIENGRSLVFITDNELVPENGSASTWNDFVNFCRRADVLIHDSQYLDKELIRNTGFGHSSYEQSVKLGLEAHAKHLIFFHHNPGRKDDEIDRIIEEMRQNLLPSNSEMVISAAKENDLIKIE
jgi:phosphoribosyl 1,2-cyclic phosphodiesterase